MKNKKNIFLILLLTGCYWALHSMSNGIGCYKEIDVPSFIMGKFSGNLDQDICYLNSYLGSNKFKKLEKVSSYDVASLLDLSKKDDVENKFLCKEIVKAFKYKFNKSNDFLFYLALSNAYLNVIKLFINSGYNINKLYIGDTPISYLCKEGISGELVSVNNYIVTLHTQVNSLEVARLLIASGANYNKHLLRGLKPIDIARQTNSPIYFLLQKLQGGSNFIDLDNQKTVVQRIDKTGFLIQVSGQKHLVSNENLPDFVGYMAMTGNLDVLELLKEQGIDLNLKNSEGESPLIIAVNCGDFNAVKLLLEMKVSMKVVDSSLFCTPIAIAIHKLYKSKTNVIRTTYRDIVNLLYKSINDKIDFKDKNDIEFKEFTQLMIATIFNNTEYISMFLNLGADTNMQNSMGHNALMLSIMNPNKSYEIISKLVEVTDLNAKDIQDYTALDMAIKINDPQITEIIRSEIKSREST